MWKVFFHTGLYFLTQRRSFEISIFLLITSGKNSFLYISHFYKITNLHTSEIY